MIATPPAVFDPILDRLHADASRHFGVPELRFEPVAYDDREFSHLLRLAVYRNSESSPLSHLFVKVGKRKVVEGGSNTQHDRVIRDFETTRRAYDSMRPYTDLGVVPPVACYPEYLAIVTEQVNGPTLQAHLARRAAWFPSDDKMTSLTGLLENTGRWIRVFQQSMPQSGEVDLAKFRDYVDHRLKKLVAAPFARFTEADRQTALQRVADLSRLVTRAELREVPTHSDLALGNILVDGTRIVVLDFAMAKTGCRLADLTRLFVQIDVLAVKPHIRSRVVSHLQRALLRGYDAELSDADPLFRLFLLRHRINHLVTLRFERSSGLSAAYSRVVCRDHERWLRRELGTDAGSAAHR